MPSVVRRTTVAGAFLVAMIATTLAGRLFATTDGVSLWWLPAAVVAVYVLTDRLAVTVPVVVLGRVVAGLLVTGADPALLPRVLLSSVTVAAAYGAAAMLFHRMRAAGSGRLGRRTLSFVGAMTIVGPLLAGLGTHAAFAAVGIEPWAVATRAGVTSAIGDAAAIIGLVPLVRTSRRRDWSRDRTPAMIAVAAAVLAVAGAVLGYGALAWTIGGESVLFLSGVPMMLASAGRRPWVVRVVVAATGIGTAIGFPRTPGIAATEVQLAFIAMAVLAVTLTALVGTESTLDDEDGVVVAGVTITGRDAVLAGVATVMRRVRVAIAVVVVLHAVTHVVPAWGTRPLPWWVAVGAAPASLLLVNGMSRYLDATSGQSLRRQRIETAADVVVVTALDTVFGRLLPFEVLPVAVVLVLVAAALRLPLREVLVLTAAQIALLAGIRTVAPPPTPIASAGTTPVDLVPLLATALLVVWLVASTSRQLHGARDEVTVLAARQQDLNAELSRAHAELAAVNEQLRATTDEARRAAADERAARDDYERFAAIVAHDLASPMATLQGITTILQRSHLDEETRAELLRSAASSASRASTLIDRLHEHARAGATSLEHEEVRLDALAVEVRLDHDATLSATGSTIAVAPDLPTVTCDRVLVRQLLSNLVGNALRHGADESGVARVRIDATVEEGVVAVTVSDEGPGIPADVAAGLFTVGVRGRRSRGLGLGMATCRTIAERHGGDVTVDARPGGGTIARVTLPSAGAAEDGVPGDQPAVDHERSQLVAVGAPDGGDGPGGQRPHGR